MPQFAARIQRDANRVRLRRVYERNERKRDRRRPDPTTGLGTVVGVIGGYEQGGNTPSVSYAAAFGGTTRVLYAAAVAAG